MLIQTRTVGAQDQLTVVPIMYEPVWFSCWHALEGHPSVPLIAPDFNITLPDGSLEQKIQTAFQELHTILWVNGLSYDQSKKVANKNVVDMIQVHSSIVAISMHLISWAQINLS